jgi:hypothetical protein
MKQYWVCGVLLSMMLLSSCTQLGTYIPGFGKTRIERAVESCAHLASGFVEVKDAGRTLTASGDIDPEARATVPEIACIMKSLSMPDSDIQALAKATGAEGLMHVNVDGLSMSWIYGDRIGYFLAIVDEK